MIKTCLFLATTEPDPFTGSGPDAAERIRQLCPTALGYVQSRALAQQLDAAGVAPFTGIAELWFSETAHALAAVEGAARLAPMWSGGAGSVAAVVTGRERVVMRRPEHHDGRYVKGVFPFRRKAGLAVAEFQLRWWHGHGPIAARTEGALAYFQYHPPAACYVGGEPPHDGVTELHWLDVAGAKAAMASRQMREDQTRDAERFVEPGSVTMLLVDPETVIAP